MDRGKGEDRIYCHQGCIVQRGTEDFVSIWLSKSVKSNRTARSNCLQIGARTLVKQHWTKEVDKPKESIWSSYADWLSSTRKRIGLSHRSAVVRGYPPMYAVALTTFRTGQAYRSFSAFRRYSAQNKSFPFQFRRFEYTKRWGAKVRQSGEHRWTTVEWGARNLSTPKG
jgi:hypothetical protein